MAVPSGKYEVVASVDQAPLFGEIRGKARVGVTVPGEEILEQRLEELKSEDAGVRRTALIDLRYFAYYGILVALFLFGAVRVLEARKCR